MNAADARTALPYGIVAIDHGSSLVARMEGAGHPAPGAVAFQFRLDVISVLSSTKAAVICRPEELGYAADMPVPIVVGLADLIEPAPLLATRVGDLMRCGAGSVDAVKLCFVVSSAEDLTMWTSPVAKVRDTCENAGADLIVEVVRPDRSHSGRLVHQFADVASAWRPARLKLPFPDCRTASEAENACSMITEAARGIPWMLLSAGSTFDRYQANLKIAMSAGCSGFVAGTAVWQDAIHPRTRAGRLAKLESVIPGRVQQLLSVTDQHGGGRIELVESPASTHSR